MQEFSPSVTQKANQLYAKFCFQQKINPFAKVKSNLVLVSEPGLTDLQYAQTLNPTQYKAAVEKFSQDAFHVVPFDPVLQLKMLLS